MLGAFITAEPDALIGNTAARPAIRA